MAGDTERALVVLEEGVDKGFRAHPFMATHCPFMAPLRGLAEFDRIMDKAKRGAEEFRRALATS